MAAEVAALREMHPSDVAARVRSLPLNHRRQLAEVMEDERLADLLEELPEDEQLRIIEGLDLREVEAGDYELICLPLKIAGGSGDGAPARAVLRTLD